MPFPIILQVKIVNKILSMLKTLDKKLKMAILKERSYLNIYAIKNLFKGGAVKIRQ